MKAGLVAVAAVGALLTAGCGSSGGGSNSAPPTPASNGEINKTGQQVADDAATALEQSGAVHTKGSITVDGKPGTIDLQLQGSDISGTLSAGGAQVSIVSLAGKTYLEGSSEFWSQSGVPAAAARTLNNRWVLVPASEAKSITSDINLTKIGDDLRKPSDGTIQQQVKPGTFNGQPTVVISTSAGSTADVAATGKPYPLHLVNNTSDKSDITFSGFGQQQTITAPPNPLDLGSLNNLGG